MKESAIMKKKKILGTILTTAMIFGTNIQPIAANVVTPESYPTNTYTIQTDQPTLFTYEQFLELIEQAPDITETRSNIELPDRHITESEMAAWIEEYWELGGVNSFELEVIRLINIERERVGHPPLAIDPILIMAARFHAQEMAEFQYFNHFSPHHGNGSVRAVMFGHENIKDYVWGVWENIHSSTRSPEIVVQRWMDSPGHRTPIIDADAIFLTIGVGAVQGGGTVLKFGS